MIEKVCPVCGQWFATNHDRICCSERCTMVRRAEKQRVEYQNLEPCPLNDGVVCGEHCCDRCGWNPVVSEERVRRFREGLTDD